MTTVEEEGDPPDDGVVATQSVEESTQAAAAETIETAEPEPAPEPEPEPAPAPEPAAQEQEAAPAEDAEAPAPEQAAPESLAAEAVEGEEAEIGILAVVADGSGTVTSFTQCANGDEGDEPCTWVPGVLNDNNSGYAEGDWVQHKVEFADLEPGTNTLVLEYDLMSQGKYAYDDFRIDSFAGAESYSFTEEVVGDTVVVTITFEVAEGTDGTGTLLFSTHIASELDYGPGMGAGSINGAPYHVSLLTLNNAATGQQDNQLMAAAVDAGEVTIIKEADPEDDGSMFGFTIVASNADASFSLYDDGSGVGDRVTYRVAPGTTTVSEVTLPGGWSLEDIVCTGTETPEYGPYWASFWVYDDDQIVCTFYNAKTRYDDLVVTKDAMASYDVDYTWLIEKTVDREYAEIPAAEEGESTAPFEYTVRVTPDERTDSNWLVEGTITVTNPNDLPIAGVDVIDEIDNGGVCTVEGGLDLTVPANDFVEVDYECTYAAEPAPADGTNTATATWSADDYYGSTGMATGTADVDFAQAETSETNRYITVWDDQTDPENPVELVADLDWEIVAATDDGFWEHTYTLDLGAEPGTCEEYTNTAWIEETEQSDTVTVEVCVGADLMVSKNVILSLTRTYDWDIDKSVVGPDTQEAGSDGEATFDYEITVTPLPYTDSDWAMSGEIEVTNPNDWDVVVDVTDTASIGGGVACTVENGEDATIPANDSVTFDYTCMFESEPALEGINTATITWDAEEYFTASSSAEGTADITAEMWDMTHVNDSVTVWDDGGVLVTEGTEIEFTGTAVELGTATWEDGVVTFDHTLTFPGEPGTCVDYTNTAWLEELPDIYDDETVTVCWTAGLEVDKDAWGTFDRTHEWEITKDADVDSVEIVAGGEAVFHYTVIATPTGYVDDGWEVWGTIELTNPNDFTSIDAVVTDMTDIGGVCTVFHEDTELVDGEITVPADTTLLLDYECVFDDVPDFAEPGVYEGLNTVTVTWDDPEGALPMDDAEIGALDAHEPMASASAAIEFELDVETDAVVTIWDDATDPENPVELGTTDLVEGMPVETVFEYDLALPGEDGECMEYTNIAWIAETEAWDTVTVEVCAELPVEVTKTAEGTFDRTYLWTIDKTVDHDKVTVDAGEKAVLDYTVTVTPDGYEDDGWELGGTILVTNPNAYKAMTVTVSDEFDGIECDVVDGDVELAPGETVMLTYACELDDRPEETENVAVAWWTGPDGETVLTSEGAAEVEFVLDTETNHTITVTDDKAMLTTPAVLGTATWNADGTPTVFDYTLHLTGEVGVCTPYTNTATIEQTDQSASANTQVCVTKPPRPLPPTGTDPVGLAGLALLLTLGGGALVGATRRKEV